MKLFGKMLLPLLATFLALSIPICSLPGLWLKYSIDKNVLMGANLLFMGTGVLVFFMQKNALTDKNPHVFIRSVMAGMMIKMFSTVLAVLAYVVIAGAGYDKKAVFISLFMYLLYLAAEVAAISKENSKKNV
ncbi:MAG: hypothetical protein ACKVOM_00125 [Ferruginibacter sp.]